MKLVTLCSAIMQASMAENLGIFLELLSQPPPVLSEAFMLEQRAWSKAAGQVVLPNDYEQVLLSESESQTCPLQTPGHCDMF